MHCERVTQAGFSGNMVYDTLGRKTEEIWRLMHSDATRSEWQVDPDRDVDREARRVSPLIIIDALAILVHLTFVISSHR